MHERRLDAFEDEHAVTVHDFVETKSEADERRARRRGELKSA